MVAMSMKKLTTKKVNIIRFDLLKNLMQLNKNSKIKTKILDQLKKIS